MKAYEPPAITRAEPLTNESLRRLIDAIVAKAEVKARIDERTTVLSQIEDLATLRCTDAFIDELRETILDPLRSESSERPIVHILHGGWPLCGFSRVVPGQWPRGNRWVGLNQREHATCPGCIRESKLL